MVIPLHYLVCRQADTDVSDAGENFALHVVTDVDAEGVVLVEANVGHVETVLIEADTLPKDVTLRVNEVAVQRVATAYAVGISRLLHNEV